MSKLKKFKQFLKSPKTDKKEDKYHKAFIGFIGKGEKKTVKENYHDQLPMDLGIKDSYGETPYYNYHAWNKDSQPRYKKKPLSPPLSQGNLELKSKPQKHAGPDETDKLRAKPTHLHDELHRKYTLDKHLSHEEQHSMKKYSDSEYMNINKYLYSRGQKTDDYEKSALEPKDGQLGTFHNYTTHYAKQHFENIKSHIKNLSHACRRYKTDNDMVVFSGISRSPERFINKDKPLDHIRMKLPAYTSTSINKDTAEGFSKADHEHPHYHVLSGKNEYGHPTYKKITSEQNDKMGYYGRAYKHILNIHIPKGSHGLYLGNHSECSHEQEFLLHKNSRVRFHPHPTYDHNNGTVNWHGTLVHDGVKWTEGHKKK